MHGSADPVELQPLAGKPWSWLRAGDPPPDKVIDAETSDDEDAPITSNDEFIAAVAAVRVGY